MLNVSFFGASRRLVCVGTRLISIDCLQYETNGDPTKVVNLTSVKLPDITPNSVHIKWLASPINPADINIIQGVYPIKPTLPAVGGFEGVGEVVAVGSEVSTLNMGDRVIPSKPGIATWCTYGSCKDEREVIKIRREIPLIAAATLSVNPCTAYRMLKDFVDLKGKDVIVQNGANSGVGQGVIQLAREMGLISFNIIRDRERLTEMKDYLKGLGANYVVTEEEFKSAETKKLLSSIGSPKLALNCVGGKSTLYLASTLGVGGKLVSYGGMSKRPLEVPVGPLIFKDVQLHGFWLSRWKEEERNRHEQKNMLDYLMDLIVDGRFKTTECETVELKDYKLALSKSLEGFSKKQVFVF